MKTKIFYLLFFLLILPLLTALPASKANTAEEPIVSSFIYLINSENEKYGGDFYLSNTTDRKITVTYRLKGSKNVNIQSDGGITDVPAYSKVWVVRVVAAGPGPWESGTLYYNW